ncbi:unnamed protein product [Amoebophrya sp. A25]|nr:unnamed protein product [Amoebophrya sp. A25]|eukprot:GSA25T00014553001.1
MLLAPNERHFEVMYSQVRDNNHPEHIPGNGPEQDYLSRFFADRWSSISPLYNWQIHQMFHELAPHYTAEGRRCQIMRTILEKCGSEQRASSASTSEQNDNYKHLRSSTTRSSKNSCVAETEDMKEKDKENDPDDTSEQKSALLLDDLKRQQEILSNFYVIHYSGDKKPWDFKSKESYATNQDRVAEIDACLCDYDGWLLWGKCCPERWQNLMDREHWSIAGYTYDFQKKMVVRTGEGSSAVSHDHELEQRISTRSTHDDDSTEAEPEEGRETSTSSTAGAAISKSMVDMTYAIHHASHMQWIRVYEQCQEAGLIPIVPNLEGLGLKNANGAEDTKMLSEPVAESGERGGGGDGLDKDKEKFDQMHGRGNNTTTRSSPCSIRLDFFPILNAGLRGRISQTLRVRHGRPAWISPMEGARKSDYWLQGPSKASSYTSSLVFDPTLTASTQDGIRFFIPGSPQKIHLKPPPRKRGSCAEDPDPEDATTYTSSAFSTNTNRWSQMNMLFVVLHPGSGERTTLPSVAEKTAQELQDRDHSVAKKRSGTSADKANMSIYEQDFLDYDIEEGFWQKRGRNFSMQMGRVWCSNKLCSTVYAFAGAQGVLELMEELNVFGNTAGEDISNIGEHSKKNTTGEDISNLGEHGIKRTDLHSNRRELEERAEGLVEGSAVYAGFVARDEDDRNQASSAETGCAKLSDRDAFLLFASHICGGCDETLRSLFTSTSSKGASPLSRDFFHNCRVHAGGMLSRDAKGNKPAVRAYGGQCDYDFAVFKESVFLK